ncbi:MAG: FkbM family methyltransferase [Oscillospiraceae bacterium]|nr:FkbM family methyltransferase [Oscillospiraceae bacterium]
MGKIVLRETESVWERLAREPGPVVLYGMGDGADKALDIMESRGIPCAGVFASDGFVRGQSFRGFRVQSLAQTEERWNSGFTAVMCFAVHDRPTLEQVRRLAARHPLVAPDMPVAGEDLFTPDYYRAHEEKFQAAYEMLEDESSRRVFCDVLDFKISGKTEHLFDCESPKREAYALLCLGPREHYVDCGAYTGDTVEEFLEETGGKYGSITALEPDPKNFAKLEKRALALGLTGLRLFCRGAWDRDEELEFVGASGRNSAVAGAVGAQAGRKSRPVQGCALDGILSGSPATFLKMDVEGSERRALEGARETILRQRPALLVSAYHRSRDLFDLPLYLREICPGYRFYLRRQPYIPAWEISLLAVPAERRTER